MGVVAIRAMGRPEWPRQSFTSEGIPARMSDQETPPSGPFARILQPGDRSALATMVVAITATLAYWFWHDHWLGEYDILSYFLPWYSHLGDRLSGFDLPGWMPWLAAGSPLAGDPSGGWWYLPVMLTFSLFEPATAFKGMILVQVLVGSLATYAFARRIGFRPIAALLSTMAFSLGPFVSSQLMYGTVAGQVNTWIPVALLGVECALRASRWMSRAAWWGLGGLAISQIAVSWPGQGLYNALLIIGAWVAYRSLIWTVSPDRTLRQRWIDALTTGPAVLGLGLLLGAAGLLPRLETSNVSNIRNGDYEGIRGGNYLVSPHTLASLLRDTLSDDVHQRPISIGAAVVVLAILAIVIGRQRAAIPFFTGVLVVAGVLSTDRTLLHDAFALLPQFETIHEHSPRRVLWVCMLPPAMLAGAGLDALLEWRPRRWDLWPARPAPAPDDRGRSHH